MKGFHRLIIPAALLLLSYAPFTKGQHLIGLAENRLVQKESEKGTWMLKSALAYSELALPFFEDFSRITVYPDPLKWTDRYVFINSSFANEPPSIGVATLDAVDDKGEVYALTDFPASSDTLTSQPIDLSAYSGTSDTVLISFFYLAGGNGEMPEKTDSLLLELFSPVSGKWTREWFAIADTAKSFMQAIIPVPANYYTPGFRFRFRNYTSTSARDVIGGNGALGNADVWNIDYILVNALPRATHISIEDVTLLDPPRELIDHYEIIPWKHLNDAQSITRNTLHYVFRNLAAGDSVNIGRSYYLKNLATGVVEPYEQFFGKFGPTSLFRRNDPFFAPFTRSDDSDEGRLEVIAYLITAAGQPKQNDTARTLLHFRQSYAYDDGTPEYGFGISGESTAGALLACRFRLYKTDTLRAVDFYFNKTRNHFNADLPFQVCVWRDENGQPGELLYISPEDFTPGNTPDRTDFIRCPVDAEPPIVVADTSVFVGWKQGTEEFLNLGYDVNRNTLDRLFVNITGDWFNPGGSLLPGTAMIRAVFGGKELATGSEGYKSNPVDVRIYPNPASDIVFVDAPGLTPIWVNISSIQGNLSRKIQASGGSISTSGLAPGIYLVQVICDNGESRVLKLVIAH